MHRIVHFDEPPAITIMFIVAHGEQKNDGPLRITQLSAPVLNPFANFEPFHTFFTPFPNMLSAAEIYAENAANGFVTKRFPNTDMPTRKRQIHEYIKNIRDEADIADINATYGPDGSCCISIYIGVTDEFKMKYRRFKAIRDQRGRMPPSGIFGSFFDAFPDIADQLFA